EHRHAGLGVLAVHADGDLAQSRLDRHRGFGYKRDRRCSPDELLREVVRAQSELAAKLLGMKEQRLAERRRREQAVDVLFLEAGVVERPLHGLGLEAPCAAAGKLSEGRVSDARDGRLSRESHVLESVTAHLTPPSVPGRYSSHKRGLSQWMSERSRRRYPTSSPRRSTPGTPRARRS